MQGDNQQNPCYCWEGNDLLLSVVVQPRASQNNVVGLQGRYLKIRLKAPPVDGKANTDLINYVARIFKVPKSNVHLISGDHSKTKRLRISNPKIIPTFITLNH